jgi:anti-sigma factor RsiW
MEPELTCRDVIELLRDYLDGELPARARSRFDRHLAECRDCAAYAWTYQETVRLGRAALDPDGRRLGDVPEEVLQAIVGAVRREAT